MAPSKTPTIKPDRPDCSAGYLGVCYARIIAGLTDYVIKHDWKWNREDKIPRDGSGVYSRPAGTVVTSGTTIESAKYNTFTADVEADLNTARPISTGGTGATSASAARTALGLTIGTNVQAYDATLQSLSSLGTVADRYAYTTGVDTWAEGAITSFARTILDDADAGTVRTTIGAQASDQDLTDIAGITRARGDLIRGGASAWEKVALGTSGQVLTSDGTDAGWATPAGGLTLLGTIATTSGTSQSLSSLTLTSYRRLLFVANGVSHSNASNQTFSVGGVACSGTVNAASVVYGDAIVDLTTGRMWGGWVIDGSSSGAFWNNGNTGYSTATTSVSVGVSGASFDAGSVQVYGVK